MADGTSNKNALNLNQHVQYSLSETSEGVMRLWICIIFLVTLTTISCLSSVEAMALGLERGLIKRLQSAGHLNDGTFTQSPRAFQNFCGEYTNECVIRGTEASIHLDDERLTVLEAINHQVNGAIRPQPSLLGASHYMLGVSEGNCNEYAVEKRHRLLELGWSSASLSLAVVRLPSGEGHLVLTARTDHGDLVLDNLNEHIVAADRTTYTWIRRQSAIHPRLWVNVNGIRDRTVAVSNRSSQTAPVAIAWNQGEPSTTRSISAKGLKSEKSDLADISTNGQTPDALSGPIPTRSWGAITVLQSAARTFGNQVLVAWQSPVRTGLDKFFQFESSGVLSFK